jgi:hypothetical protein
MNQAMKQQRPQRMRTQGTFISANQSQLQLTTNTNQVMTIGLVQSTEVSVTGTAEQSYLKSGVLVEFVAEVPKGGAVAEKISQLTVVSPDADRPPGLYPPDTAPQKKSDPGDKGVGVPIRGAGANPAKAAAADPGIGDDPVKPAKGTKKHADAGDLFGAAPAKSKSGVLKPPGTFAVRATVKSCKDGKIMLGAGHNTSIKAELASDVTIDVDMTELRVVQRDDKVTVDGIGTQAQPTYVAAKTIKVELANPLTGSKKRPSKTAKTPASDRKAKKPAGDAADLLGGGK